MRHRGGERAGAQDYDHVPYPSTPHRVAHPSRLSAIARLHRLEPADPASCTYLDLGCGDAVNPLSVAASLPGSRCFGIDLNAAAIARGHALRDAAGLGTVELRTADLRDPDATEGFPAADYIDLHGILSWVDEEVREAAMALAARQLAPSGILVASYNALPGWRLLQAQRDFAMELVRELPPDAEQHKRVAVEALELAIELHGEDDAYGRALALAADRYRRVDPEALFHDDLAGICEPLSLTQVVGLAGQHGLRYVGEALSEQWWAWRLAPHLLRTLREAERDEPVARQARADFASGAVFKASLFVRAGAEPAAEIDPEAALGLRASLRPAAQAPEDGAPPALKTVFESLAAAAPGTVPVAELAGLKAETAAGAVLRLVADQRADLWHETPRFAERAGPRPEASPLARAQLATGSKVANLRHETVHFTEPLGSLLLELLDGSRDRPAIASELSERAGAAGISDATPERVAAGLDGHLDELARRALLRA